MMYSSANSKRKYILPFVMICLSVCLGFSIAFVSLSNLLIYLIGTVALVLLLVISMAQPSWLVYIVILTSATAGILSNTDSIDINTTSLTLSGIRWVALAVITCLIIGFNLKHLQIDKIFIPFYLLVIWIIQCWLTSTRNTTGLKDILFFSLPPLLGTYIILMLTRNKIIAGRFQQILALSAFVPLLLYIVLIPLGYVQMTSEGPIGLMGPRPVATYLLITLSLGLSQFHYSKTISERNNSLTIALVSVFTIIFTLSRMALATALCITVISVVGIDKLWRLANSFIVAALLVIALFYMVPSLYNRVFYRTPSNLTEAITLFNTSGRDLMWSTVIEHAEQKILFGWGPGNARLLVGSIMSKRVNSVIQTTEYPPHNEYLQITHDTGLIGLLLLLGTWPSLLVRYFRRWRANFIGADSTISQMYMMAFLCSLSIVLNSFFDNTLHYAFIVGPVALIVGYTEFLSTKAQKSFIEHKRRMTSLAWNTGLRTLAVKEK